MKQIIILFLLISATFVFAQKELSPDYDYQVSEPYKVVDARTKEYFSNDKEVLGVKIKPKKNQILLQKYNIEEMKEQSKQYYNDLPKNFVYEGTFKIKNKYFLFYSSWSGKETKQERLYYREIDFKNGKFQSKAKQLINYKGWLNSWYGTMQYSFSLGMGNESVPKFNIILSQDNSKVLIQYLKKKKAKRNLDLINITVFDSALHNLWSKDYTMPYNEYKMTLLNEIIDNNGNVYMISKVRNKIKAKNRTYHLEFFKMGNSIDQIIKKPLEIDEIFMDDISFEISNKKKQLVFATFYKTEKKHLGVEGVLACKLDFNGELISMKSYTIPKEILNQYRTKIVTNQKKYGDHPYNSFSLDELIFNDDKSITLIGESSYIYSSYSKNVGAYNAYYYNDIMVLNIDKNEELNWIKRIPKRQMGTKGKRGMSYFFNQINGYNYLIYVDNIKNSNLPLNKTPAMHYDGKGGFLTIVKINNKTGEVNKDPFLDFTKIKNKIVAYQFSTDRIVKIKEDSFFVEVYKKKKEDVFLKVEIKQ